MSNITFDDIRPHLFHRIGCRYDPNLMQESPECDCGFTVVEEQLKATFGRRCLSENCYNRANSCGKCKDHCECKYPYDEED